MASASYSVRDIHAEKQTEQASTPACRRIHAFAAKFEGAFGPHSRPWLMKTIRELRGAIVFNKPIDAEASAKAAADHFGKPELWEALVPSLLEEIEAFSAESEGHPRTVTSTVFDEDHGWIIKE